MSRNSRPAIDRSIASAAGVSRDGQPLSYNRAPAADLAPWIGRLYVTVVEMPDDYLLDCGLFNDTPFIRIQLRGQWTADTADGRLHSEGDALFFGPHTRRMPVSVRGSFTSVGLTLRPGACHALRGPGARDHLDRICPLDDMGLSRRRWLDLFDPDGTPEDWCRAMEDEMRQIIAGRGGEIPELLTARFEAEAFVDPSITVTRFAREMGVEQRRLERCVRRDFGMPPKQVLRRARALDMASHLRGVADHDEAEALSLRYYDQSHLIREFTDLFGMSPRQFVARPQPLMTLALETRQSRRLEMIERIQPGQIRPWQ